LHDDLSVYISSDNATYTKLSGWQLALNGDGSITLNFPKIFTARYIKINTIWDDRDISDNSIDESTFKNTPSELVKVWTLVTSRSEAYAYDAMGNRSSVTTDGMARSYTYYQNPQGGNLSWVRYDGAWYYEYDQDGNRILKAKALLAGTYGSESPDTSQEYWNYTWDLHNRLVSVAKDAQQLVAYTYDAENFRVERTGPEGTTVYAYDRDAALAYEKNLSSGASRTIVHLGGQIIGWTETVGGASTRYYVVTDQLGSVTEVLDANAKVVWQSEYTPFGTVAGAQGSISFSGMFSGEDIDPDTHLTYQWNRWRSEDGSSWLSEDPAQNGTRRFNPLRSPETVLIAAQVGGAGALALGPQDYNGVSFGGYDSGIGGAYNYNRLNWYEYCDNNPLRFLDPSGLIAQLDDSPGHNVTYNPHTGVTKVNGHVTEYDHPGSSSASNNLTPEQAALNWAMTDPMARLMPDNPNFMLGYGQFVTDLSRLKYCYGQDLSKYGQIDLDKMYMNAYNNTLASGAGIAFPSTQSVIKIVKSIPAVQKAIADPVGTTISAGGGYSDVMAGSQNSSTGTEGGDLGYNIGQAIGWIHQVINAILGGN